MFAYVHTYKDFVWERSEENVPTVLAVDAVVLSLRYRREKPVRLEKRY